MYLPGRPIWPLSTIPICLVLSNRGIHDYRCDTQCPGTPAGKSCSALSGTRHQRDRNRPRRSQRRSSKGQPVQQPREQGSARRGLSGTRVGRLGSALALPEKRSMKTTAALRAFELDTRPVHPPSRAPDQRWEEATSKRRQRSHIRIDGSGCSMNGRLRRPGSEHGAEVGTDGRICRGRRF